METAPNFTFDVMIRYQKGTKVGHLGKNTDKEGMTQEGAPTLKRFHFYWNGAPSIDVITFVNFSDPSFACSKKILPNIDPYSVTKGGTKIC